MLHGLIANGSDAKQLTRMRAAAGSYAITALSLLARASATTVVAANVADLEAAVADASVSLIQLEVSGSPYLVSGTLVLSRTLTIEGACAEDACVVLDGQAAARVVRVTADGDVVLRRLAITNGRTSYPTYPDQGGGASVDGGSLLLEACAVTGNSGGGGLGNHNGALVLRRTVVAHNEGSLGGGVYSNIKSWTGSENRKLWLIESSVRNNVASFSTGGLYAEGGTVTRFRMEHSSVVDNECTGTSSYARAGGIYLFNVDVSGIADLAPIEHCLIARNQIRGGPGGGLVVLGSGIRLYNTTIRDNHAATDPSKSARSYGGGLYMLGYYSYSVHQNGVQIESSLIEVRPRGCRDDDAIVDPPRMRLRPGCAPNAPGCAPDAPRMRRGPPTRLTGRGRCAIPSCASLSRATWR